MADLKKALKSEKIQGVQLRDPLSISHTASLKEVFSRMREEKRGYAVVVKEGTKQVVGIFTERDALTRVAEQNLPDETPIADIMTKNPSTLKNTDSVADIIRIMNQGHYRHIPIVDNQGEFTGLVGVKDLMIYLAEHYPHEIYNLPPDPHQIISDPEGA